MTPLVAAALVLVGRVDGAQDPTVTAADPAMAEQATYNLDVVITGSGFEPGATASFFVTGTSDPGGILVNSTTYRNPKRLIANIDVAAGAQLKKFDIKVELRDSRSGQGQELFRVLKNTKPYHLTELGRAWGMLFPSEVADDGTVVGSGLLGYCRGDLGFEQLAAIIHTGIGNTTVGPVAPAFVDTVCEDCDSEGLGVDPGGNLAAGAACEQSDVYDVCRCNLRAAVWERQTGGTWVRSYVEPPSSEPTRGDINSRALGVAEVGGAWLAVGRTTNRNDRGKKPAVWRQSGSTWSRGNLPLGAWTYGSAVAVNASGLVAGFDDRAPSGYGAIAWDCSVSPCAGPYELPISGFDRPKVGSPVAHINEAGDIAGNGVNGKGYSVAVLWPFTGTAGSPSWGAPVVLPGFDLNARATASEHVSGVLTVVGQASSSSRSNRDGPAVRWRRSGTTWSGPERLAALDDARVEELGGGRNSSEVDINNLGQICVTSGASVNGFVESPNF